MTSERTRQGGTTAAARGERDREKGGADTRVVWVQDQGVEKGTDSGEHERVGAGYLERTARRHAVYGLSS